MKAGEAALRSGGFLDENNTPPRHSWGVVVSKTTREFGGLYCEKCSLYFDELGPDSVIPPCPEVVPKELTIAVSEPTRKPLRNAVLQKIIDLKGLNYKRYTCGAGWSKDLSLAIEELHTLYDLLLDGTE